MNNEETTNLTEDTIYFWNEHAKPALSWIADRWMECYELSPGWTIGITVIGGLYALASILPDDDENPKEAAVEACEAAPTPAPKASAPAMAKKTRWNYALTLADPSECRTVVICPSGSVQASSYSEAMNLVHNKYADNRLRSMKNRMVIAEVSESHVRQRSFQA